MDTDIVQVEGPMAGYNQAALDQQKVARAPLQTELLRAQAGKASLELQNQKTMMEKMAQYGSQMVGQADGAAGEAGYLGRLYLESGMPEKALTAFDKASLIRSRTATADAANSRRVLNAGKALAQDLDTYERYMRGATDQTSFDAANAAYFAETGKFGMFAGHEFSPQMIGELRARAIGAKDSLNMKLRADENASRDRLRGRREQEMDALDQYRARMLELAEQRNDRLDKAGGGKAVTSPSRDEQTEAGRLINRDFPDFKQRSMEEFNNATFSIAARARELRRQNPALNSKEAISRAYVEQSKDFVHSEKKSFLGFTTKDAETKYLGEGKNPETAMRLPSAINDKTIVKDRYYVGRDGSIGQYLGNGKVRIVGAGNETRDTDPDEEDDPDDAAAEGAEEE